jgi:hypothetical protein
LFACHIRCASYRSHSKQSDWLHKNGYGLKFYREGWVRFPEPSYWTIVRYKPKLGEGKDAVAWGIRTWRGITETLPRRIPSSHKKEWRILLEPGTQLGPSLGEHWTAPSITLSSAPRDSTQLPDDLPGALPAKWPYPWGKLGTHNFPATNPRPLTPEEKALAEEEAAEDAAWAKAYAKERGRIMGGHRAVDADAENADASAAAEGDAATEGAAAAEAAAAPSEEVVLDVEAKEVAAETEAEKK